MDRENCIRSTFGPQQRLDAQAALLAVGPQAVPVASLVPNPRPGNSLISSELLVVAVRSFHFSSSPA